MNFSVMMVLTAVIMERFRNASSYYIVEAHTDSHLNLNWNVPTFQCRTKNISFDNLTHFGITQNSNDSFHGNRVVILYDPGLFPAIFEVNGNYRMRNGGVPQEGDILSHLEQFEKAVVDGVPDEKFDGLAIIDFESWRPIFRQNFGVLTIYKNVSYNVERKRHPFWPEFFIKREARYRFEQYGRLFMVETLQLAQKLRPKAKWGYYGFPYCFNAKYQDCSSVVRDENDEIRWLWDISTALYPSVYSSKILKTTELKSMIKGRLDEASRVNSNNVPLIPYTWYRYRDGGFFNEIDLKAMMDTISQSTSNGIMIWGSSNDVNSREKCDSLHQYIYSTYGPIVKKYTKNDQFRTENIIDNNNGSENYNNSDNNDDKCDSNNNSNEQINNVNDKTTVLIEEYLVSDKNDETTVVNKVNMISDENNMITKGVEYEDSDVIETINGF